MKRTIATVLALLFVASFSGCSNDPAPTEATTVATTQPATEPTTAPTEVTTEPVKEYAQEPMVAVSLPAVTEYTKEGEVTVFSHTYQYMTLIQQDPAVAEKIVLDFQTRLDGFRSDVESYIAQAKDNYNGNSANWNAYLYNILYEPTRVDQSVLSLYGTRVLWSGAVHPEHHCISANYNMITGDVMTLGSILAHEDQITPLGDLLIEQLAAIADEKSIMSGYEEIIRYRLESNVNYDEDWYFSNEGLCFYFSPYEIAPYSSGTIVVTIPYDKLVGVIDDPFFPTERDYVVGQIDASRYQDTDHTSLTQIAEVVLDRGGEMVFLYTDGKVYDVSLELGQWNPDGTIYTPTCTVFATQALTPGDAVMVETYIPDVLPTLRLTYTARGKQVVRYIFQSGEDGSILLMEN